MAAPRAALQSVDYDLPKLALTSFAPRLLNSSVRIPALDGLRGIAILLVVFCHTVSGLNPGSRVVAYLLVPARVAWSGVDLFFVLSGFLIGGILLDARSSHRYYRTFYLRRAFRILPLYGLVLMVFSLRFLSGGPTSSFGHFLYGAVPWLSYASFTQNIWMAVARTFGAGALGVTWSLAVEEQFYLTMPLFVREFTERRLATALGIVVLGAPVLRSLLYAWLPNGAVVCYVLTPCRADALSLGVLCALAARNPHSWRWLHVNRKIVAIGTAVLFLGIVLFAHWSGHEFSSPMVHFGYTWLAVFYAGCLLLAITSWRGLFSRILQTRVLTRLGMVAYFTYLVHVPLIEFSRHFLAPYLSAAANMLWGGLAGCVLTLILARISWRFFEKPLIKMGHTYRY